MSSYFGNEENEENDDEISKNDSDVSDVEEEDEDVEVDVDVDEKFESDKEEDEETEEPPAFNIENIIGQPEEENEDMSDEDEEDEHYLQKFNSEIHKNYVNQIHPECIIHNQEEINALASVVRNKQDMIIDGLHKTLPFLTKFEKTRILGQRTKQINSGAPPFVKVPDKVIDGYIIAQIELMQKMIPFIIRRPLPDGTSEYWKVSDLENILL